MKDKRRVIALVVVATAAIIAAGGLMASNMGFKLNYPLAAASGTSNTGRQTIGLPYNRQVGIDFAADLRNDINAGGISALSLEKFDPQFDTQEPYPGPAGNFPLTAGEGYLVRVATSGDYIIVGSHDPGYTVSLKGTSATSNTGRNHYAHPYHGVSASASELKNELQPSVLSIEKFDPQFDTQEPYPGPAGDFPLVPGESYLVRVVTDKDFVPAHY